MKPTEAERELFKKFSGGGVEKLAAIVGSEARTEHVIDMNGNARRNLGRPFTKYMGMKIVDARDGEEIEVNECEPASPYAYKYFCRMDDLPVLWDQIQNLDPMLRATKGLYMIKYTPIHSKDYRRGRPFKIGQDLIRWDVRVSGPKEWHELCKKLIEFGWMERNSTLTDELFRIAKMHPGMTFWFSVDWVRYEKMLQAQSKEKIAVPFGARKASVAEYREIKKHNPENKTVLIRYFNDILKEVNTVEALPSVQEEMLSESGEAYNRSRGKPRDPVTGQFLRKNKED